MKLRLTQYLLLVACLTLLNHCAKVSDSHLQVNQKLTSPYTKPAAAYLAMAKMKEGEERQTLQVLAAGRLIHDGQWHKGQTILARLKPLTPQIADEKYLLLAKVALIRDRPSAAINYLAKAKHMSDLSLYYQSQYHELLAEAYKARGNAANAVSERMKLGQILPDKASKSNNLRELWLTVTDLPSSELNSMAAEAEEGSEYKGWMELAAISRQEYEEPHTMVKAVDIWNKAFPHHPANNLLRLGHVESSLFTQPKQVALLLPLSGPLAGPGKAVRDGFFAAYRSSKDSGQLTLKVFDTHNEDVALLYTKAVEQGADYVVGPLSKSNVAKVASLKHPVPTLLLNDLNKGNLEFAYQFGLSPENEARQVASKARRNGYTRALVITPDGAWGEEVADAFAKQWQENGGSVVDTLKYSAKENLNQPIRDFLHISASEARKKALKQVIGGKIDGPPRRRQDFDMIFLLAYPSKARQIMPLLRYYYAGDVPVYSTSMVYAGHPNSMKDRDLNGIIFCDMPWVFHHNLGHKNWPEQLNSYNRLYALGLDSYALSSQLNHLLLFPAMGIRDKSGILYLNGNKQVGRIPTWGQFKQGLAQELNGQAMT